MTMRIAIIGAGISGLTLADALSTKAEVTVFEKARGVGGRMSTRYADPYYFDHGTQFFTVRTELFQQFLKPYADSGVIAPWEGKVITREEGKKDTKRMWFEPHFVASPNMNSLCKAIAANLQVRCGIEVAPLDKRTQEGWLLKDKNDQELGVYDWIISTVPPEQTARLFDHRLPADSPIRQSVLLGCYALMLGFSKPLDYTWIATEVHDNPIKWISFNHTKPGRNNEVASVVAHSTHEWAEAHIDNDMKEAENFLLDCLQEVSGIRYREADFIASHRWRYATVKNTSNPGPYIDVDSGLAASGDWCTASRIEDAWTSSMQLADTLGQIIAV